MEGAREVFVMLKKTRSAPPTRAPWPSVLVEMAAVGREDGGMGLHHLLEEAGFTEKPSMTIIVKRQPRARLVERVGRGSSGREREINDPYVDDVLDALRSMCA
jgi:hypothetical protein